MSHSAQSRRDFIRSAALFAAGGMVIKDPSRILDQPDRKLGFALVGLGSLSTNQLAPALLKTKYCRLAGIVTGTPAKAARWKERYNLADHAIYNYDTMSQLANNPEVDVVYVVTPNALHAEHTNKALNAGKHVFCEKPMEVSVARCQSMIDTARRTRKKLAIAYRCQFDPQHLAAVALARDKTFGEVKQIEAAFGFPAGGDPSAWRFNHALSGGGPLMDVGVYALQTARMIAGREPVRVTGIEAPKTDPDRFRTVEEAIRFDLEFSGGLVAKCNSSYKTGMNSFTVTAERGTFGMAPAYNYGGNRSNRSDGNVPAFAPHDMFATEMDDFARCILDDKPSRVAGEEGLQDVKLMMAIYESARTGRPVNVG